MAYLTYSGKNMGQARDKARGDNKEIQKEGLNAKILVSTMKWNKEKGRRGQKGIRYYDVEYAGNLDDF